MSECVVRMEMPKGCRSCQLCVFIGASPACVLRKYPNDTVSRFFVRNKRPSNCPLICALPEGHGRLGDLDCLQGKVNAERIRVMQSGGDTNPYWECGDLILQTPTIIPATKGEFE